MKVKTDTKEKFHVIRVESDELSANMAADLKNTFSQYLLTNTKNIVLSLAGVASITEEAAETIVRVQQNFYEKGASFVICEMQTHIEDDLDKKGLLELMNVTPTESEAWDIVQMEEIERELLDDEDGS
jgi:anti-anti-sigma factor